MRCSLIIELLVRSSLDFDDQAELRNTRLFVSSKVGPVSHILTSYFERSLVQVTESVLLQTWRVNRSSTRPSRVNTSCQNRRRCDTAPLQAMTKPYGILQVHAIPVNPQSHPTTACIPSRIWFSAISALTPSHPRISYLCDHALEECGEKDGC